jgi:hypothetical protein
LNFNFYFRLPSFFQKGRNTRAIIIAQKSAIGVAQTIPAAPDGPFSRNMKGMSKPPFLSRERSSG